jgi:broad specificity phosphatase PhoE
MARPRRIVLIRHGQSEGNADKAVLATTPDYRLNLSPLGREQARAAGRALGRLFAGQTVRAYVSPFFRARQTFEEIQAGAAGGFNVASAYEDPRIREQDFGHLRAVEAVRLIEAERRAFGAFFYRVPDGESGADVYDRISGFLDTLWRDFEKPDYPQNALLVSHGLTVRLFLMRWFHWSVETFERLRNPSNCEFFVMELDPETGKYALTTPLGEFTEEETQRWRRGEDTADGGIATP